MRRRFLNSWEPSHFLLSSFALRARNIVAICEEVRMPIQASLPCLAIEQLKKHPNVAWLTLKNTLHNAKLRRSIVLQEWGFGQLPSHYGLLMIRRAGASRLGTLWFSYDRPGAPNIDGLCHGAELFTPDLSALFPRRQNGKLSTRLWPLAQLRLAPPKLARWKGRMFPHKRFPFFN